MCEHPRILRRLRECECRQAVVLGVLLAERIGVSEVMQRLGTEPFLSQFLACSRREAMIRAMKCWVCGDQADSGEHMIKASDLKATFGNVAQKSPLFRHTNQKRNQRIGGIKSTDWRRVVSRYTLIY